MRTICKQYLKKVKEQIVEKKSIPLFDENIYSINKINFSTAKTFICKYEYLGTMGFSKYCFGLFFGNNLAAVVCYVLSGIPTHLKKIPNYKYYKILQLCRGATSFWAPKWAASKLISQSLKILKNDLKINFVIAYSDENAGEIGTIYQACNAIYLGKTNPGGSKEYIINDKRYHSRKVYRMFGSRSKEVLKKIDPNYKSFPINKKHRYLFILGNRNFKKKIKTELESHILPYPKRERSFLIAQ